MTTARTIEAAGVALREGAVTSVALTEAALARADRHDGWLGAFLARFDEQALARAAEADRELAAGIDRGPLHGIPLGIKDLLIAREGPTTAQSLVVDPAWGAGRDATVVARLRDVGAVIVGKTSTMELALGLPEADKGFPVPVNPWRASAWPGGSSSGTASGVAAGFFLGGLGTDTGGSVRIPAAACGVTGLMPTYGRVPRTGCLPLASTLDRIGPLARTAWDCAALLGVLAGADPGDGDSVPEPVPGYLDGIDEGIAGRRVGVVREHHLEDARPEVAACFEAAVATLAGLGAEVVEITLPRYRELVMATFLIIGVEALAANGAALAARWGDHTRMARQIMAGGSFVSGAEYLQAQRVRRAGQRLLAGVLADVDLIATPTLAMTAPELDAVLDPDNAPRVHTVYWNAVGAPVISLPMGFVDELPLGLQLAAAPFAEALLVRAGRAFQRATAWHEREPDLDAVHGR